MAWVDRSLVSKITESVEKSKAVTFQTAIINVFQWNFKNSFRMFINPFELLSYSNLNSEGGDRWANSTEEEAGGPLPAL